VRLAETRAAEGETETAGQELVVLGQSLLDAGKIEDAEKSFRRASELIPDRAEPALGLAACLTASGREDEVLGLLEKQAGADTSSPELLGALLERYEMAGRSDEALELMRRDRGHEIPTAAFRTVVAFRIEQQSVAQWWKRSRPLLDHWAQQGHSEQLAALYGELASLETAGHIPALLAHYHLEVAGGDRDAMVQALEKLIRAHQARSLHDEAAPLLDELRKVAPRSELLKAVSTTGQLPEPEPAPAVSAEVPAETAVASPVPVAAQAAAPPAAAGPEASVAARPAVAPVEPSEAIGPGLAEAPDATVPVQAEAPAVPLNKSDEEFVSGRLTQADILEKYGLHEQALEQIREVTEKFPGHVSGQQRLVALLRNGPERVPLREALVGLALARRAAGEADAARQAASEARRIGSLPPSSTRLLEQLELLPTAEPPPAAAPPARFAAPPPAPPSPEKATSDDDVVLIDFDQVDDDEAPSPAEVEAAGPSAERKVRPPSADMLEEIRSKLARGELEAARRSVDSLRAVGYEGEALDAVSREIEQAAATAPSAEALAGPAAGESPAEREDDFSGLDDDDDLSAITAALESELFAETADPVSRDAESEQSLEDVFAAFKHYDLGIGYKEMGLLDEAIREFEIAVKAPELFRESCAMLAVCHRERQEMDRAIDWYRRAIDAPGGDQRAASGLRYELAEALLLSGDREAALSLFRDVMQADPSYRDVRSRIAELETAPS
jgi:tetratricopeptide (TPR) repeat protein